MSDNDLTRRDFVIAAGVATAASAASNQVVYGAIGTGAQGTYLLHHMAGLQGCRCAAVCDTDEANLKKGAAAAGTNPQAYKDYRELLGRKDIDAVVIATPLSTHFPITQGRPGGRQARFLRAAAGVQAGGSPRAAGVGGRTAEAGDSGGAAAALQQVLPSGARSWSAKGLIGNVTHIAAQWHRNPGWLIPPDPASERSRYWMIFREYSAGLAGELGSHQIDVAGWMFNAQPEYVIGIGGQEFIRDGRDIYDNIQLLYRYRKGQKLSYSAISTNQHLPLFGGTRAECGETIMGTGGTIEITLGSDKEPCDRAVVLRAAAAAGEPRGQLPGAAGDWRRHAGEHGKRQERFPAAAREGPVPRR